jgi:hypothetical protein
VSGAVLVRLPGARTFTALTSAASIPLGTTVDATRGAIAITAASDERGHLSAGRFHSGTFRITQLRVHRSKLTVLTLVGPRPQGCRKLRTAIAAAHRPTPVRSLWGSASGGFRTVGRYGSATERGTTWLTEDTCAGTLIKVTRDAVTVHDFAHHRVFVLRAPHSLLLRPGRGG